jgi:hypothetical protein
MTDGSGCGRVGCALMEEGVPPEKGKDGAAGLEPEAELEPDELEPEPEVEVSEVDGSTLARMMSDAPKSDAESLLVFARPMGIFEGLSEEEALTRCKEALAATPGYDISDACDWLWEQAATEEEDAAAVRLLGWDPPKLKLSTTELLWGVGADTLGEQTQELVLSNPSGSDVCFTSKISRRARFALSPSNCVVAAGGSVPVRVTLLAMESLPEPDERTDRILLLAAWRGGDPAETVAAFWGRWRGQIFHQHVACDLVLPEDAEPGSALSHTRTLSVNSYAGQEVRVMFHGTDSRAAQLIACSQRFRPSVGGLLGDGVYVTRTRQKAEGYRVHHPNAGSIGGTQHNLARPSGQRDPGCILQFRVRLGACRTFTRDDPEEELTGATWHEGVVLEPTSTLQAAAAKAGVQIVRYNSAHSAGCPCCPEHGEDCPGSPKKRHFVPPGVTPCEGRCRTGFRVCPRANSAWEEFCVFNPARIDQIEIIDGPEELIGFGREFWGVDRGVCDVAVREKQLQLDAEAEVAMKVVEAAVKQQRETVVAVVVTGAPSISISRFAEVNGIFERVDDDGGGDLFKNEMGWCMFVGQNRPEWRVSYMDERTSNRCAAYCTDPPEIGGCVPSGSTEFAAWDGSDWVQIKLNMTLCGLDEVEEIRQKHKQAREARLASYATSAQSQLSETAAILVSGCPDSRHSNGTFHRQEDHEGWPHFHNGAVHFFFNVRMMEWHIGSRFLPDTKQWDPVRIASDDGRLPTGSKDWKVWDQTKKQHTTCTVALQFVPVDEFDSASQHFEAEKQKALASSLTQLRPVGAVVVSGCPNELCNGTFQHISPLVRMSSPTPGWLRPRVKQEEWPRFENEHGFQLYNYHQQATNSASNFPEMHWRISAAPWNPNPGAFAFLKPDPGLHHTIEDTAGVYNRQLVNNLNTLIAGQGLASRLCTDDAVEIALRDVFRAMMVQIEHAGFASSKEEAMEARRQFGELRGYDILRPFLAETAAPCAFLGATKICAQSTIINAGCARANKDLIRGAGLLPLLGKYLHRIPMNAPPVTVLLRQPDVYTLLLESASAIANSVGNIPSKQNTQLMGRLGYIEALVGLLRLYGPSTDNERLRHKAMLALKMCCRNDMLSNCARLLRIEDSESLMSLESCLKGSANWTDNRETLEKTLKAADHLREAIAVARASPKYVDAFSTLPEDMDETGVQGEFGLFGHPIAGLNGRYTERGTFNGCPLFRQVAGTGALYKYLPPAEKSPKWNFVLQYSVDAATKGLVHAAIDGDDDCPPAGCRTWRWCPPKDFAETVAFAELNLRQGWQDIELTLATTEAHLLIREAYDDATKKATTADSGSRLAPGQLAIGTADWQCFHDGKFADFSMTTRLLNEDEARIAAQAIAVSHEVYCESALSNARAQLAEVGAIQVSGSGNDRVDGMFVPSKHHQSRGLCFENEQGKVLYNFCPERLYPSRWYIGPELGASTCHIYHATRQHDYTLKEFLALCGMTSWCNQISTRLPGVKTAQHLRTTPALEFQRAFGSGAGLEFVHRSWALRAACTEVVETQPQTIAGQYRCYGRNLTARVDVESDGSVLISDCATGLLIAEGRMLDDGSAFACSAYERKYTVTLTPKGGLQWTLEGDAVEAPQCYRVSPSQGAIKSVIVRKEFDRTSEQIGRLATGTVVVVLEVRLNGEQERVRLAQGGWTSVKNLQGGQLLVLLGSLAERWDFIPRPHESSWPNIGEKMMAAVRNGPSYPASGGGQLPLGPKTMWMKRAASAVRAWSETTVTVQMLSVEEREAKLQKQRELKQATLQLLLKRAFDQVAAMKATGMFVSGFPVDQSVHSTILAVTLDLGSFNGRYSHSQGDVTTEGFPVWRLADDGGDGNSRLLYRRSKDGPAFDRWCFNSELTPGNDCHWAKPQIGGSGSGGAVPLSTTSWHVFNGSNFDTVELTIAASAVPGEIAKAGAGATVALLREHASDDKLGTAAARRLKTLLTLDDDDACQANAQAIAAANGCAAVVHWLQDGLDGASRTELACSVLYTLASKNSENKHSIGELGGPLAVVVAMDRHRAKCDTVLECCKALQELCTNSVANCVAVAACNGLVLLIDALKRHGSRLSVVTTAITTLITVCDGCGTEAELRPAIVTGGGIEAALGVMRLRRYDAKLQHDGLLLLYKLAGTEAGLRRLRSLDTKMSAKMALARHTNDAKLKELATKIIELLQ